MHSLRNAGAMILAAPFFVASTFVACAQDTKNNNPTVYRDVETKYIFGFTEGSGIGLEGEKEFSWESVARFGKADGRYWASETKLEYEFTPNQYVQFELGPLVSTHNIKNVTDFENRSQVAFGGFFGEIRYLLLDRGPSSPLAITLSAEPEWRRADETTGQHVTNFELEFKVNADLELISEPSLSRFQSALRTGGHARSGSCRCGLGKGIDRRRFRRLVLSNNPCGVCGCRGLVPAPLRRDLVQ